MKNATTYHEIDFLLPAQRFNINFSYITQKGLPFVREFVLRLVHLTPMSKSQISAFFGFSRNETEEAIADLVEREELTLMESGRLTLTEKSRAYFTEIGEIPRLSLLQDSGAYLSFDLATFTCLGKDLPADKWNAGIAINVDNEYAAKSEAFVEKQFQRQFNEILHKGYLSKALQLDERDSPTVYTVNSVNKVRQLPLRLTVKFRLDGDGRSVERDDFANLKSSDYVQERITFELSRLKRPSNAADVANAMTELEDEDTLKVFEPNSNWISAQFLDDLTTLEGNSSESRITFIGPIYSSSNWELLRKHLAPVLVSRIQSKSDSGYGSFIWIAPSDPYWSKSNRLQTALGEFFDKASTKEKKLYTPTLYVPISAPDDFRSVRQWKQELGPNLESVHGLLEGFLSGNVEIMLLEGEFAMVVYHMSLPDNYPITIPIGFISRDKHVVSAVEQTVSAYIRGSSGFDRPNDCGLLTGFGREG